MKTLVDIIIEKNLNNETHIEFQAKELIENRLKDSKDSKDSKENKQTPFIFENVCYKENSKIPIIEESAKLKIAYTIVKQGHIVIIRDTEEIINEVKKEYGSLFQYEPL